MTGVPRRIDGLGRIVIPAELRAVLDFQENDDIEIFIDDGILKVRKYVKETYSLLNLFDRFIRVIERQTRSHIFITDNNEIIVGASDFVSVSKKKEILENYQKVEDASQSEQYFRWCGIEYMVFRIGAQINLFATGIEEREKGTLRCGARLIRETLDWISLQDDCKLIRW